MSIHSKPLAVPSFRHRPDSSLDTFQNVYRLIMDEETEHMCWHTDYLFHFLAQKHVKPALYRAAQPVREFEFACSIFSSISHPGR